MLEKIKFWPKTTSILKNEEGVVMIAALMVLVLLTIIGIASTKVSNTEVRIASRELIYQQNFYRAEGATMEALEVMENDPNPKTTDPDWLWAALDTFTADMPYDSTLWDGTLVGADATPEPSALSDTSYVVVSGGIVEGESLDIGSTKIHRYAIYGRCAPPNRGATTVEIGYLKAF
jgi:Tfp pilus assembly protein PilX